jgi:hypothetical protein
MVMKITCRRFEYGDTYTIGRLYIDGSFECFVLEDKVRSLDQKIKGHTAIPSGRYRLVIDYSPKFDRQLLHLLDVPNFAGVRIHSGNTAEDTEGCLLVGKDWNGKDMIYNSRAAYQTLSAKIAEVLKTEKVYIDIVDTV